MARSLICMSIIGGAVLLMAGCGGSSGGGSGNGGSGGGNSPTTITFTIAGQAPTAVAARIGSGSFTAATPASGKLTLSLPSGTTTFAVAFACPAVTVTTTPPAQATSEYVFEASSLDGTSFTEPCPSTPSTGTTGTLTGSVDATQIPGTTFLNIDALNNPNEAAAYLGSSSGSFSFAAPAGTDRVQVLAYNSSVNTNNVETLSLVGAKVFASQTVPGALNGGNTVTLGAADETTMEPITYNSEPPGFSTPSGLVIYENADFGGILLSDLESSYPALPAGALESGGFYHFQTSAAKTVATTTEEVAVEMTSPSGGPVSLTFPQEWSYAGPAVASWPSFDMSYAGFSGKTGVYDEVVLAWFSNLTNSPSLETVVVTATGSYLNGSTTLAIPDLTGLTGFVAAPTSGTLVEWTATIAQGSFVPLSAFPSNGTVTAVSNTSAYTAP